MASVKDFGAGTEGLPGCNPNLRLVADFGTAAIGVLAQLARITDFAAKHGLVFLIDCGLFSSHGVVLVCTTRYYYRGRFAPFARRA